MKKKSVRDLIKEAADARSDLNIFYAVISLMESSLVSSDCFPTESRIISICKTEAQRCLVRMDKATAKACALASASSEGGK